MRAIPIGRRHTRPQLRANRSIDPMRGDVDFAKWPRSEAVLDRPERSVVVRQDSHSSYSPSWWQQSTPDVPVAATRQPARTIHLGKPFPVGSVTDASGPAYWG